MDSSWSDASSQSFASLCSTQTVENTKTTCVPPTKPKKHLNVSFQEAANRHYESNHKAIRECRDGWYSKKEIQVFKTRHHSKLSQIAREPSASHSKVLKGFLQTYQTLSMTKSGRDADKVFQWTRPMSYYDADMVGLERSILRPIQDAKKARRQTLLREIQSIQGATFSDETRRANKIRQACATRSRPSRLFAHYVAIQSANAR